MLTANAPLLPTEILNLGLITNGLTALLIIAANVLLFILIRRALESLAPSSSTAIQDDGPIFAAIIMLAVMALSMPFLFWALSDLLTILIAPRLYIIEEMSRLNP